MLKKVGFMLQYANEKEKEMLKIRLEQNGLEVICEPERIEEADLLVTDFRKGELFAESRKMVCLGLELKESLCSEYICLDSRDINPDYLEKVYRRKKGIPWDILTTKRCLVREMTVADMDEMYRLYADREITEYVEALYQDREKEKAYIEDHIRYMYGFFGYGMWLIFDRKTKVLIGRAGICNREIDGCNQPEIGYVIGKAYQRQGYGAEVCREILIYAKEELGLEFLNCFVEETNLPSIRLAEKLGFRWIGETGIENLHWYRKNL